MSDNEEIEGKESWYDTERRLKIDRARQDYLDRHPFHKDKVEIKPMRAVIELAQEYFEDNENSDEFELEKAVLGSKLGIGSTKTLSVCNVLSGEYDFITDSRGFITIDRKGFLNWLKLREELEKERERNLNQHKEAQALIEEIKRYQESNEGNDRKLAEQRSTRDKLKQKFDELSKEKESLPKEIEEQKAKLLNIRAENDKLKEESSENSKEIEGIEEENKKKRELVENQQITIEKRKDITPLELLKEENTKLKDKVSEYERQRQARNWERNENLKEIIKGILAIFLIVGFVILVSYGIWYYFSDNILLFGVFEALFLIIFGLIITRI